MSPSAVVSPLDPALAEAPVKAPASQDPIPALEARRRGASLLTLRPPLREASGSAGPLPEVAAAFRGFLSSLGLDLEDPNLAGTADRVARACREMLRGLWTAEPTLRTFPNSKNYRGMVSVAGITTYSICAHHFLPFFGVTHVGYLPGGRLVGLSKLPRVVDFYARRPQLQEDLTEQVAALLDERLAPAGVIVTVEARHLCMEMRGVSRPGVTTRTMAVRGAFHDERLQRQFLTRLDGAGTGNAPGEA